MSLSAFSYYGGKYTHLKWLLPYFVRCNHFVDVCGGSAAAILNVEPYPVETYNDINGDVVNFFKVLRNRGDQLIDALSLTPYSRVEFENAMAGVVDELEMARRFFIVASQAYNSVGHRPAWRGTLTRVRCSISESTSRWLNGVAGLRDLIDRLQVINFENLHFRDLIPKYDQGNTLFYIDPPYYPDTRVSKQSYRYEMTKEEHKELADILNEVKGFVCLSGYDHDFYNKNFPSTKWRRHYQDTATRTTKKARVEMLLMNYED
jgi:DNA adenine methylase